MRILAYLLCLLGFISAGTAASIYNFTSISVPGAAGTMLTGINDLGIAVGNYTNTLNFATHGFELGPAGKVTTIDASGAGFTTVTGINNVGQVSGFWSPDPTGNVEHAFVYGPSSTLSSFDVLGNPISTALGVNSDGTLLVSGLTEPGPSGWYLASNGHFTPLVLPGLNDISITGFNDTGLIVGEYFAGPTGQEGFAFDRNTGALTLLTVPGSTETFASAVNDSGTIVGRYETGYRGEAVTHGFVYSDGVFTSIDVPGATGTSVNGINEAGDLVGDYTTSAFTSSGSRGFIALPAAAPVPEPKGALLVCCGLALIVGRWSRSGRLM